MTTVRAASVTAAATDRASESDNSPRVVKGRSPAAKDVSLIKCYLATCLSMACAGTTSLFATYGSSFSEILGFTQYETNIVASFGDYGHYFSAPLWGYLTGRVGPRRVTACAAVLMFVGYAGLSYAFKHFDTSYEHAHHYVATMTLLFACVGIGSKAGYMSGLSTTAHNYRYSRYAGITLGIPNAVYGLSTFIFSTIKGRWFESDPSPARYLWFVACISLVAHFVASRVMFLEGRPRGRVGDGGATKAKPEGENIELRDMRRAESARGPDSNPEGGAQEAPVALTKTVATVGTRQRRPTISSTRGNGSGVGEDSVCPSPSPHSPTEVVEMSVPPPRSSSKGNARASLDTNDASSVQRSSDIQGLYQDPQLQEQPLQQQQAQVQTEHHSHPPDSTRHSFLSRFAQSQFGIFVTNPAAIFLLAGLVCCAGPAITLINNSGVLVRMAANLPLPASPGDEAHSNSNEGPWRGMSADEVGVFRDRVVAIQSLFSCIARLAIGYLSDIWRTRLRLPRSAFLIFGGLLILHIQHLAQSISHVSDITYIMAFTGVGMGTIFTIAPTYVSETWGADSFGVFWGIMSLGPAFGGHMCNLIFGAAWDAGVISIVQEADPSSSNNNSGGEVSQANRRLAAIHAASVQCDQRCFSPAFAKNTKISLVGVLLFTAATLYPIWVRRRRRRRRPQQQPLQLQSQ